VPVNDGLGVPVSVIIPAHNAESTIARAIESVLAQSLPASEIIVIDDGSSDRTAEIAGRYAVRVESRPNGGPASARNIGIRAAKHAWIAFLDADDTWLPDKVSTLWRAIALLPDATFLFSGSIRVQADGTREQRPLSVRPTFRRVAKVQAVPGVWRLENASLAKHFLQSPFINLCSVVVRRESLMDVGLFDESLHVSEDFDLWLRLFVRATVYCIEDALVTYHQHERNISADRNAMIRSIVAVRERIEASPQRYPRHARTGLERYLVVVLRAEIRGLLLRGDATRARTFAGILFRFEPLSAVALAICGRFEGTRPGQAAHGRLRALWRRLRRRPSS
jgi:glycosyltransferase involved in cell wall biosynthesis